MRPFRFRSHWPLTLILLAAAPLPRLAAQGLVPSGTGFSVAGSASFARSTTSGSGLDGQAAKPGGQAEVAYGASPRLALLAAYRPILAAAGTQRYTANGLELGLRYLGQAGRRVRPFLEGGFAVRTLRYEQRAVVTAQNVGPWASVGAMRLAAGHWSAEAAATWTATRFENWKRSGEAVVAEPVEWSAIGARVGLRYWVRAR